MVATKAEQVIISGHHGTEEPPTPTLQTSRLCVKHASAGLGETPRNRGSAWQRNNSHPWKRMCFSGSVPAKEGNSECRGGCVPLDLGLGSNFTPRGITGTRQACEACIMR